MLDAEDRQTMLEAVGVTATLPNSQTMLVMPPQYGDPQVVYSGAELETMNPCCLAAGEDIAAQSITAGESGTILTIIGRDYRVLSIEPMTNGFSTIELGAS